MTTSTTEVVRDPVTFYALLPLACFACVVLGVAGTLGAPFSPVVGLGSPYAIILLLPTIGGALFAVYSLARTWISLLGGRTSVGDREVLGIILGCLLAIGFICILAPYLGDGRFAGDGLVRGLHVFEALISYVIVGVVLLFKQLKVGRKPLRTGKATSLLVVLLAWMLSLGSLPIEQLLLDRWWEAVKVSVSQRISVGTSDAFTLALCRGELERARHVLQTPEANPAASLAISTCLSKEGWIDHEHRGTVFFAERVPLVLDAIAISERHAGIETRHGCTELQIQLLNELIRLEPGQWQRLAERQLPVDCVSSNERGFPVWWDVVYEWAGQPAFVSQLQALQAVGIDLQQRNAAGGQILSSNINAFTYQIRNSELLFLIEQGLDLQDQNHSAPHVCVEVAIRRFAKAQPAAELQALNSLIERVGEPTAAQLVEARKKLWADFDSPWRFGSHVDKEAWQAYVSSRWKDYPIEAASGK